jgi:hypothetical protein
LPGKLRQHGAVASLEEMFDPDRLKETHVLTHRFLLTNPTIWEQSQIFFHPPPRELLKHHQPAFESAGYARSCYVATELLRDRGM